ncbi:MAG: hypothetical protein U0V48_11350 [Anaerolineales bacterium]
MLSGPRGAAVGDFLSAIPHDSQIVGAVINGDLRELTFPVGMDSRVTPGHHELAGRHAHPAALAHLPA